MSGRSGLQGAGLLAGAALLSASACSQAPPPAAAAQEPPGLTSAERHAPIARHPPTSADLHRGSSARTAPVCGPPYYSAAPHISYPAIVATAARAGVSPPARSLQPTKPAPPGSVRVIPLHRLPPAWERCPPPAEPPAART